MQALVTYALFLYYAEVQKSKHYDFSRTIAICLESPAYIAWAHGNRMTSRPRVSRGTAVNMLDQPATSRQTLEVRVKRVLFNNSDNDFYILLCEDQYGENVKILGLYHENPEGLKIVAYGNFEYSERHGGQQFKADFIEPGDFTNVDSIRTYLASLGIPGISDGVARNIVNHFGLETFDVIDENPDLLFNVERMPEKSVTYLHEHWRGFQATRDFVLFLIDLGISPSKVQDIRMSLGFDAERVIRDDPYILCRQVNRFSFEKADAVAFRLGIPQDSPVRRRAYLEHVLQKGLYNGECGQPRRKVINEAANFLRMPGTELSEFTDEMIDVGNLAHKRIDNEDILYLPHVVDTEHGIARMLLEMSGEIPCWGSLDAGYEIKCHAHQQGGPPLGEEQDEAVQMILNERLSVMTGGPGVGKTTTLKTALDILCNKGVRVALCAPTGMAAKRMSAATGREAGTIHRLLEFNPGNSGFMHNVSNPLDVDLVVADEFSMADINLAHSLIEAIGPNTSLLIVGDVDQLPSVGPGRVLDDIISSNAVPVSRLTQVYRQSNSSRIITAAHAINRGDLPEAPPGNISKPHLDFLFIDLKNPNSFNVQDAIIKMVCDRLAKHPLLENDYDPIRDVMIVAARKDGPAGTMALNDRLRERLNPLPPKGHSDRFDVISGPNRTALSFGIGDKVMNTVNNYDKGIVNGDIGYVVDIDDRQKELVVNFESGPVVSLTKSDASNLLLAYAITVHKSQGSESRVLLMPMVHDYKVMLQRNLVYTGLTRAKTLGIMVGEESALNKAINTIDNRNRWSLTGEALRRPEFEIQRNLDFDF